LIFPRGWFGGLTPDQIPAVKNQKPSSRFLPLHMLTGARRVRRPSRPQTPLGGSGALHFDLKEQAEGVRTRAAAREKPIASSLNNKSNPRCEINARTGLHDGLIR
jgi:hypothetical protein